MGSSYFGFYSEQVTQLSLE